VGGTSIDDSDDILEGAGAGAGLTLAAVVLACLALLLALLPIVVAIVQPAFGPSWINGVAGGLAASVGVVKLVAMAWGAGSRLVGDTRPAYLPALAD
jgi:hypothetical protein